MMNIHVDPKIADFEEARQRFLSFGPEALSDDDHLTLLLQRLGRHRNPAAMARKLLDRFGSFAEVLAAPDAVLRQCGLSPRVALDLKLLRAVPQRILRSEIRKRPVLTAFERVIEYCRAAMAFEPREQFRILFLDKKNQLIADEVQQEGTVDHAPVYPREIVRRALELSASALILVHNHPSGDPTPSRADINMTRNIAKMVRPLGIELLDHIVVGRNGHTSFKRRRLI
jgi:DNA repair protein RadC